MKNGQLSMEMTSSVERWSDSDEALEAEEASATDDDDDDADDDDWTAVEEDAEDAGRGETPRRRCV